MTQCAGQLMTAVQNSDSDQQYHDSSTVSSIAVTGTARPCIAKAYCLPTFPTARILPDQIHCSFYIPYVTLRVLAAIVADLCDQPLAENIHP